MGPLGALLEPFGEVSFAEAYANFAEAAEAGARAGADLVLIEPQQPPKTAAPASRKAAPQRANASWSTS